MGRKINIRETVTLAYSPATFAKNIDRSVGFVRLEIQRGALKVLKRGRAILITKAAADEYLRG
jgi:hypothetical protein